MPEMSNKPTKVLYIAGWQRSGSTILHRMLGQVDGFFPGSELWYIWERGLLEDRLCGCGAPFRECPFWTELFRHAYGGMDIIDAEQMNQAILSGSRTRQFPLYWTTAGRQRLTKRLEPALETIETLYRTLREHTGSQIIVDSSKSPGYGYMLDLIPEIELYVIHLIRDPRAVSYSWQRKKKQIDSKTKIHMSKINPVKSALLWNVWNKAAERFQQLHPERYIQMRYEDIMQHPRQAIEQIVALSGENANLDFFLDDHTVYLDRTHTIAGNPNRFQSGAIELKLDLEWRQKMNPRHRRIVTALTAPLLARYGYR